jgi:hypothetical protein
VVRILGEDSDKEMEAAKLIRSRQNPAIVAKAMASTLVSL